MDSRQMCRVVLQDVAGTSLAPQLIGQTFRAEVMGEHYLDDGTSVPITFALHLRPGLGFVDASQVRVLDRDETDRPLIRVIRVRREAERFVVKVNEGAWTPAMTLLGFAQHMARIARWMPEEQSAVQWIEEPAR